MTYRQLLAESIECLRLAGVPEPDVDAYILFEYAYAMTRSQFLLHGNDETSDADTLRNLIQRRAKREPVQYITGRQDFYGLEIHVDEHVLIPRQDTEVLVEWILSNESAASLSVLDMCTGSGCIILALNSNRASWHCTGVDISEAALSVARNNNERLGLATRFIHSDLFSDVEGNYDVIVSNPPYIRTSDIETLMDEVRIHEPVLALDGGDDGLDFYKRLATEGKRVLKKGGRLYLEIGHDEADDVSQILSDAGYSDIEVKNDLAGLPRCVKACNKTMEEI